MRWKEAKQIVTTTNHPAEYDLAAYSALHATRYALLEQAGWVRAKAIRLLGMTLRQIAYRIQMLSIELRRL
jgi:transcriptional regulator with GAF, ATPase, and Fis domain